MTRAQEKLISDLAVLRPGGRFNPEVLEGLKIDLGGGNNNNNNVAGGCGHGNNKKGGKVKDYGGGGGGGGGTMTAKLRDLAQVLRRGKTIVVAAAEKDVG